MPALRLAAKSNPASTGSLITTRSFSQAARLAGLPISVIDRAKVILQKLESDDTQLSLH